MDFESIRALPLGDALQTVVVDGGATVGGLVIGGFAGRTIQNRVTPDSAIVTTTDKLKAWGSNNLPKIGLWYLLRKKQLLGTHTDLVNLGIASSVALDTGLRLFNDGRNPAVVEIGGYQILGESSTGASMGSADANTVQRLVQEVSMLRNDNAKLRSASGIQQTRQDVAFSAQGPMDPRLPPYVGSSAIPPAERERKYAFMQPNIPGVQHPPGSAKRQTKYGFAGETAINSTGGRPGAAHVQAGKMFGMQ